MDNLVNPQLRGMSVEDLNQRYADSWAVYKGMPCNILSFSKDAENGLVAIGGHIYNEAGKAAMLSEKFQWDRLNVARPRAGWHKLVVKGQPMALHLAYPIRKQWKRGLNPKNCVFSLPATVPWTIISQTAYITVLRDETVPVRVFTDEDLDGKSCVVLRGDRLLVPPTEVCDKWQLFFRTIPIASFDLKNHKLLLHIQGMEQEVAEVSNSRLIDKLQFEFEPIEDRPKKKSAWGVADPMLDHDAMRRAMADIAENAAMARARGPVLNLEDEERYGVRNFADGDGRWVYDSHEELERCFADMLIHARRIMQLKDEGRYMPQRRVWKLTHIMYEDFYAEALDRSFDGEQEVKVQFVSAGLYAAWQQTYRVVHEAEVYLNEEDPDAPPLLCAMYIIRSEDADDVWETQIIIRR